MSFKHFKHLNVPDSWERYFTKYPQGMSILEALFEWVSQVDSMVDNQNKLNDNVAQFRIEIDEFVGRFDGRLQTEVTQTLNDWQTSGFLDVVISEALQWQLDNYITTNEQDKTSINTQLLQHDQELSKTLTTGQNKQMVVGGAIRNATGTWAIINDTNHKPVNIASVTQDTEKVTITYGFTGSTVTTLLATVDETLAHYGVKVGASVTQSDAKLEFAMPLSAMITGLDTISQAPKFMLDDFSLTPLPDGSGFTLEHGQSIYGDVPTATVMRELTGAGAGVEPRLAFSDTSIIVYAYKQFGGSVLYSSTAFGVSTDNVNKPTVSFDSTTGELTVNHDPLNDYLSLSITDRSIYRTIITANTPTEFKVKFLDNAGETILTPNNNCRFYYSCGQKVRSNYPSDMRVLLRRGDILLNPANIQEPYGNIWIQGMHTI